MSRAKSGPWVAGAAFICVVLLALSWLLLISPRLTAAAETRDQVVQAQAQNDILRAKTAVLRQQFAELDEYKAELAGLRAQIPAEPELAESIRTIEALAVTHDVVAVGIQVNDAVDVVPVAPVPVPADEGASAPPEGAADGDDPAATEETPVTPVPVGPVPIEGFIAVPVTVTVLGPGPNVQDFIGALQTGVERLVLVHTLSGTAVDEAEDTNGRPATVIGDLEMTITGYVYVLTEPDGGLDDTGGAEEAPLPTPPVGKNPFAPNAASSGGGASATDSDED